MLIGYCRFSAADQSPDRQIDALPRAGVDRDHIHVDTASGAKPSRPKPDLVMRPLREDDTPKVTRPDRLSRSVPRLPLGAEPRERGIGQHLSSRAATPPPRRAEPGTGTGGDCCRRHRRC
ncbi:recombinase family protein [Streptomyces sp. NPDC047515]|uniref:recombinase family protein n=1 Tax=Streptomyces sp. NPDC047515 TaxID=3155380 RepID=UPI0033F0BB45